MVMLCWRGWLYLNSDNHRGGGGAHGIHYRVRKIVIPGCWRVPQQGKLLLFESTTASAGNSDIATATWRSYTAAQNHSRPHRVHCGSESWTGRKMLNGITPVYEEAATITAQVWLDLCEYLKIPMYSQTCWLDMWRLGKMNMIGVSQIRTRRVCVALYSKGSMPTWTGW